MTNILCSTAFVLMLFTAATHGQTFGRRPTYVSPEVHADRTVTLRIPAPSARAVTVIGEITRGGPAVQMARDSAGLWSVTVGPLPPDIYTYRFSVDGVDTTDRPNGYLKATLYPESVVEVPGDGPQFYDVRDVPHGEVRIVFYKSTTLGVTRSMWVYTPPGHENGRSRYPVLYLLHGGGDSEASWVQSGRMNIILDNLLADRKAMPMVVVMPYVFPIAAIGIGPQTASAPVAGSQDRVAEMRGTMERFSADLLGDVIPLVERTFRVRRRPQDRAIAGLSVGGATALHIGLRHPEMFAWIASMSAAIGPGRTEPDRDYAVAAADPPRMNRLLKLMWMSCGTQDGLGLYQPNKDLADTFKRRGINAVFNDSDGGHWWLVWRRNFHDLVPLLFRT